MFPFVDLNSHVGFPQAIAETSYDCVQIPYQNGKYYCPTAVYKDTKYPYGVPYSWSCPDMEEHELHPSCFISPDNGTQNYIPGINCQLTLSVFSLDLQCHHQT